MAFMILFAFTPLIIGSLLLELDRGFGTQFFNPQLGGSSLLWQHLFWIFGHPEVYIQFVPATGVVSMILPVFARQRIVGYTWMVGALVAIGFLSFSLWAHHMFAVGLPPLVLSFFSAAAWPSPAEPGQTLALVGSSGAGKSTIAQLIPRLYDVDGGAVRLGGVDVRDLTADSIRETLGMVTQDGHLFHESVRANLLIARPKASEDQLWEVLRRARLADLVTALPDGLDTVVGERGYRLSGGERQRLTIARLLLARPRVVLLDEATAHLDSTSEAAVQAALAEALTGRTAVVIAHRLSTVRAADHILVIEDGRVVEQGTHTELLAAGGRYTELYRTQFDQPPAEAVA